MIYILEDIDCLDDIVKSRDDDGYGEAPEKKTKKKKKVCGGGEGEGKEEGRRGGRGRKGYRGYNGKRRKEDETGGGNMREGQWEEG